jgi:amino acid permease
VSTILVIGFVVFVILGVVASLGGNASQYERIGESWLDPEPREGERGSAAQDRDELL